MIRRHRNLRGTGRVRSVLALVVLALSATACIDDDTVEPIFVPEGGDLFTRYVSLGNSLTAGFQSDGINDSLQVRAYPALLAGRFGATFGIPTINKPGCPAPLVAPLSAERVGDSPRDACFFRSQAAPPLVQNVAVPGADMVTVNLAGGNFLNTLILGGRTQLQAMIDAQPTLVTVWLGSGDVLNAALAGDTTLLSPVAAFQASLDALVAGIQQTPAQDAIFIGAANAMAVAPALQPGAYFWVLEQSGQAPFPLSVDDNCAPGTPGGSRLVSIPAVAGPLLAGQAPSVVVNCDPEAPGLLNEAEMQALAVRTATFNAAIQTAATDNGWLYVDPAADLYNAVLADPDLIRKCQGLATAQTEAEVAAAVQNTCPGPTAPNFFGAYISYDAVHPSSAGHVVVADVLESLIRQRHGLAGSE